MKDNGKSNKKLTDNDLLRYLLKSTPLILYLLIANNIVFLLICFFAEFAFLVFLFCFFSLYTCWEAYSCYGYCTNLITSLNMSGKDPDLLEKLFVIQRKLYHLGFLFAIPFINLIPLFSLNKISKVVRIKHFPKKKKEKEEIE